LDVEAAKTQYIHKLQTHSLDMNRVAAVKNIEFLEGFLSLMYAQYAFYHQAFSLLRDFEPTMRKLGEHIAHERRRAEQAILDAAELVVPLRNVPIARTASTHSMNDDSGGYVQVGQQEDDAGGTFAVLEEDADDLQAPSRSGALHPPANTAASADKHAHPGEEHTAAANRPSKDSHTKLSVRRFGGDSSSSTRSPRSHHRKSLASISLSPSGLFQISGYLFLRSQYSLMASWQRRWFEIKDGLLVHFQRDDEKDKESVPLHLCMVKRCKIQDRRNVFELIAPNRTYILQAESNNELNAWKACLKQAIEASLYSHTPELSAGNSGVNSGNTDGAPSGSVMGPLPRANTQPLAQPPGIPSRTAGGGSSLEIHTTLSSQLAAMQLGDAAGQDRDIPATRVAKMRAVPGNDRCVDCGRKEPEWAAINLGILMCIECSGIHRSLGVHVSKVRSVKLDNWEPELMHIMLRLGNRRANRILEAVGPKADEPDKPTAQSPREQKEPYLVQKYANRLYVRHAGSRDEANHRLILAARTADIPLALEALAQGADPDTHDPATGKTPLMESVAMGDFGMLELLLLWGANPNTRGKVTATSYMNDSPRTEQVEEGASNDGRSSKVSDRGSPKESAAYGGTALHLAARLGNVRVVWYLVRKNTQWDTPDAYGLLPLDIALEDSNVQVVMALLYAAFQKMSGLPPGTLGSRRPRLGGNGSAQGNASEPVDMLDVDDSFIRDWAVPPYSPCIEQVEEEEEKEEAAAAAEKPEKVENVFGDEAGTGAASSNASKEVSLEFVDRTSLSSPPHEGADDLEFGELQAAGH
ncbi:hypothetical protein GGI23_005825, partial [Coemansia sp. RSA 2559]